MTGSVVESAVEAAVESNSGSGGRIRDEIWRLSGTVEANDGMNSGSEQRNLTAE